VSDLEECYLLSLPDQEWLELSMKTSPDGVVITGDDWFDKKERELMGGR
tara:strand:+ start:1638 stop:1784 length:147 start_codon:yes stop_codon:yes gene_type:complete